MPEMSKFGAIPTAVICRFNELTKTEIIVLCYLYSRRNRHTGQCNPSQKDIAQATGLDKAHVCRAMHTLFQKGWAIPENSTGQINLEIPLITSKPSLPFHSKRVANSATSELRNPQPAVAESATLVAESATESCEIRNSIYKEGTYKGTYNEQREEPRSTKDEILVHDTAAAVGLKKLSLEARTLIADSIPEPLRKSWIAYVKKRLLTVPVKARTVANLEIRLGYWLTDFEKDHRSAFDKAKGEALPSLAELQRDRDAGRLQIIAPPEVAVV